MLIEEVRSNFFWLIKDAGIWSTLSGCPGREPWRGESDCRVNALHLNERVMVSIWISGSQP